MLAQGRVQGVGYRFFVKETADRLGLFGWVRNLPNGDVEAVAEGPRAALDTWTMALKKGPPFARVTDLHLDWQWPAESCPDFRICS